MRRRVLIAASFILLYSTALWATTAFQIVLPKKISELPALASLTADDLLVAVDGGLTKKITFGNFVGSIQLPWVRVSKTGSSLVDLETRSASHLNSGTLPNARFPSTLPALNGSLLTALNASNIASGTLADARFPSTLPALNGSLLTNLNGASIATGIVPVVRLPAMVGASGGSGGVAGLVPAPAIGDGAKFLRGDATWQTLDGLSPVGSVFGRTGAIVAATNDYTWSQIDKTTSSLADLATRSASALSSGTLADARFPSTLPALNGSLLTALNASNIASGTLADARFPSTLPALNGSLLTSLNGSNIASGTVALARLPVGSANQLFKTNTGGTAIEQATLSIGTSGTDFAVSFGSGTIVLNLPDASATARGLLTAGTQTIAGAKTFTANLTAPIIDKNGQKFNVLAYGSSAIDGTTDNADRFIAAYTAASAAGGGTVFAPQNTVAYVIGEKLTLPANVNLEGAGMGATILKRKSSYTGAFLWTGAKSIVTELTIDGNYPNRAGGPGSGAGTEITMAGADSTVYRVEIKNPAYIGIDFSAINCRVLHSILTGNGSAGDGVNTTANIGVWAADKNIIRPIVAYCKITNWTIGGIYGGGTGMLIQGNYLAGNHVQSSPTGGGQIAAGITGSAGDASMTVVDNYLGAGGGAQCSGLEVDSVPWTITSNTIIGQQNWGIYLQGSSGHLLSGNRVSGSGTEDIASAIAESAWDGINNIPSTALTIYTPAITPSTGTITTLGAISGRYRRFGKTVAFQIDAVITTNGTGAGYIDATLPLTAKAFNYTSAGRETDITGKMLQGLIFSTAPTKVQIRNYDNSYPGGNSHRLVLSGLYEAN
jgi:parallel beta-helix repeat protein